MSSFRYTRPRWVSTVFRVTNSACAISGLLRPSRRELRDAALRGGQLLYPAGIGIARRAAGRAQLGARALHERTCAAAVGQIEPLLERVAGLRAVVGAAQAGTQVGQRAGVLESRRRPLEHAGGLAEPLDGRLSALYQRAGAQRDAGSARGSPPPGPLEVLGRHGARSLVVAQGEQCERGVRAPARRERARTSPELVVAAEGDHVLDPLSRSALGQAQQAARLEQGVVGQARGDLVAEAAVAQRPLGGLDLASLDQGFDQEGEREPGAEADVMGGEQLQRRPGVGLRGTPWRRAATRPNPDGPARTPAPGSRPGPRRRRASAPGTPR